MKTCTHCKETKDESQFSKHKRFADGLSPWCKACCDAKDTARRERIRRVQAGDIGENGRRHGYTRVKAYSPPPGGPGKGWRWCTGGHWALLYKFGKDASREDGKRTRCMECDKWSRKKSEELMAEKKQGATLPASMVTIVSWEDLSMLHVIEENWPMENVDKGAEAGTEYNYPPERWVKQADHEYAQLLDRCHKAEAQVEILKTELAAARKALLALAGVL